MKMTDKKNVNDFILKQIQTLEEDYEIGLKQRLEDAARLIVQTGGISGKSMLKCRKVGYWGTVGEIYFEQPSINLIHSGLWSCTELQPKLIRVETFAEKYGEPVDAIRLTFNTESKRAAEGGKSMKLSRTWIGTPQGDYNNLVNITDGQINKISGSSCTRLGHLQFFTNQDTNYSAGLMPANATMIETVQLELGEFIVGIFGYTSAKSKAN